jgi:MFS family permease
MATGVKAAGVAWLITAVYYFYQYTLRSAPAVMMPQLQGAFGLTSMGVASMVGLFYWGYSPFSLVAGVAMDRLGPRNVVPLGAAAVGVGALLFGLGNADAASVGRLLQGAGGVFALVGAVYIATTSFPASRAATLIGATQMFGMAGGSAGQFLVGPVISSGVPWSRFWIFMGIAGLAIGALLYAMLPKHETPDSGGGGLRAAAGAMGQVLRNPQSILCGMIAGLLFIPTTIFDMIWGVRYLQEARGY